MKHISFDEQMDSHLREIQRRLRALGIKNASKADALRFVLQENQAAQLKFKRKPKTKFDFIFY